MAATATLVDNFDDNSTAAHWTDVADATVTVAETSGTCRITASTTAGARYGRRRSTATYDLTDSSFFAKVTPLAALAASDTRLMFGTSDHATSYFFQIAGATQRLYFKRNIAFAETAVAADIAYDATNHAYLRLRHNTAAGLVYFETSPDRATWTVRASQAPGITITAQYMHCFAGTGSLTASAGFASYDDFNVSGAFTLSGSTTAPGPTGSGAGLTFSIPQRTLSGSGTTATPSGSGAGLIYTKPIYALSGAGTLAALVGSGAGLTYTPPPPAVMVRVGTGGAGGAGATPGGMGGPAARAGGGGIRTQAGGRRG